MYHDAIVQMDKLFWNLYESFVHNSSDLTVVDKFSYLLSIIDGAT